MNDESYLQRTKNGEVILVWYANMAALEDDLADRCLDVLIEDTNGNDMVLINYDPLHGEHFGMRVPYTDYLRSWAHDRVRLDDLDHALAWCNKTCFRVHGVQFHHTSHGLERMWINEDTPVYVRKQVRLSDGEIWTDSAEIYPCTHEDEIREEFRRRRVKMKEYQDGDIYVMEGRSASVENRTGKHPTEIYRYTYDKSALRQLNPKRRFFTKWRGGK